MSSVEFKVVEVDRTGYRVYPSEGDPWDKELADAVLLLARAGYAYAKARRLSGFTVRIDYPGGSTFVTFRDGSVRAVIIEEKPGEGVPSAAGVGATVGVGVG